MEAAGRVFLTALERDDAAMNATCARPFPEDARPPRVGTDVTGLALGALVETAAVAKRP